MTQAELNRAVARSTGETVQTIAERGFVELAALPIEHEPDRSPLVIDWDDPEYQRPAIDSL